MSGIAAFISWDVPPHERFGAMTQSLRARPYDEFAEWSDHTVALGAATLHTTAESREGANPTVSADGRYVLVFDGYLSNCAELRRELIAVGGALRNRSDNELAIQAFVHWGEDSFRKLEGEFALAIADLRERKLVCARDPFGFRPLYYAQTDSGVMVASHIASIVAARSDDLKPNVDFLAQLVAARFTASDQTAWNEIFRVPPAFVLTCAGESLRTRAYYDLPLEVDRTRRSEADWIAEYRDVFANAIRDSARSDRPLAVEVSGGLDSSSVLCQASLLQSQSALAAPDLLAFAMRGPAGSPSDEIAFARVAADHVQVGLNESPLFHPQIDWFKRQSIRERDIATYPNGVQSLEMNQKMVESGARAILCGYGGDQWLDGTRGYIEQSVRWLRPSAWLRQLKGDIRSYGAADAIGTFARRSILALTPDRLRGTLRTIRGKTQPLDTDFIRPEIAEAIIEAERQFEAGLPNDPVARSKMASFLSPWARLGNDMMARQHSALGIESRNPLSSRRFVELCCRMPEDLKLRRGERRWIHREAMRGILPEVVRTRQSKAYFPASYAEIEVAEYLADGSHDALFEIVAPEPFSQFLKNSASSADEVSHPYELWGAFVANMFLLEN